MLAENIRKNLLLYQGHTVIVFQTNGTKIKGELLKVSSNSLILLKEEVEESIFLDNIVDIRYVGIVTDYHTSGNTATIDDFLIFDVAHSEEKLYEKLKYKEFVCTVTCHLSLKMENDRVYKIMASDVQLLEAEHTFHILTLANTVYLYKVNGKWKRGILKREEENFDIYSVSGELFCKKEIEDIARMPKSNELVTVSTKKGTSYKGVVGAIRGDSFFLVLKKAGEIYSECIELSLLEMVRFHGIVTEAEQNSKKIDTTHLFKPEYITRNAEDESNAITANRNVSYISGIGERGLIAKDIWVEEILGGECYYGIMLPRNSTAQTGFIGERFVKIGGSVKGNVQYRLTVLQSASTWNWEKISVAKYMLDGERKETGLSYAKHVWVDKLIDWEKDAVSAQVVEATGDVIQTKVMHTKEGLALYQDKEVDVYLHNKEVKVISGRLSYKVEENREKELPEWKITLIQKDNTVEVLLKEIEQIIVYGKITRYDTSNGMGGIDYSMFFHINDAITEEEQKNIREGEFVSYKIGVNYVEKDRKYNYCAYNVKVQKEDVKIISHEEEVCTVVAEKYYANLREYITELKEIRFRKENFHSSQIAEIDKYDYPAYIQLKRELGENVLKEVFPRSDGKYTKKKIQKGQIQYYSFGNGYIIPWKYRQTNATERKNARVDIAFSDACVVDNRELNTREYVYDVMFEKDREKNIASKVWIIGEEETELKKRERIGIAVNVPSVSKNKADNLIKGETFEYIVDAEGNIQSASFDCYKDKFVLGVKGETVRKEQIQRYGILTGFDFDEYKGYINGNIEFSLSLLDEKTQGVVKTEKRQILVVYTCNEEGQITKAWRGIRMDNLRWELGKIVSYDVNQEERSWIITIEMEQGAYKGKKVKHYLSVSSDEAINTMAKRPDNALIDETVYVKIVAVANEKAKIKLIAGEIRLEKEEAEIRERQNEGNIEYAAYRHEAKSFVVNGNEEYLKSLLGKKNVMVSFSPDEEQGTELLAEVHDLKWRKKEYFRDRSLVRYRKNQSSYENNIGLYEECMKKELEHRIAEIASIGGKTEKGIVSYDEYNYIIYTLLRVETKERQHIYNFFLPLLYGDAAFIVRREPYLAEEDLVEDLKQLFLKLFCGDSGEWLENAYLFLSRMVMLDENSFAWFKDYMTEWMNETLADSIISQRENFEIIRSIDENSACTRNEKISEILDALRNDYIQKKSNWGLALSLDETNIDNVCSKVEELQLTILDADWNIWKLVGKEDRERISEFFGYCASIQQKKQEENLKVVLENLNQWIEEVKKYPTQIVTEVLLENKIPECLKEKIEGELKEFSQRKELPKLFFGITEHEISKEQQKLDFYLLNGTENGKKRKDAQNIKIFLKLYEKTEKNKLIKVQEYPKIDKLSQFTKEMYDCYIGEFELPQELANYREGNKFLLRMEAEWSCEDKHIPLSEVDSDNIELILINRKAEQERKNQILLDNPYRENDGLGSQHEMFFGRKKEKLDILTRLIKKDEVGQEFIETGVTIYVYGQKRCGKSSLLNQISEKGKLKKEDKIFEKSIVLTIDANLITRDAFSYELRDKIIEKLLEVAEDREEEEVFATVVEELEDYELSGDNYKSEFEDFMEQFHKITNNEYKIILIIDEFTSYCSAVTRGLEIGDISPLEFISNLKALQFVQIFIGHERMQQILQEKGLINYTTGRGEVIKVTELSAEDARSLIVVPMEKYFGYNPYKTVCGELAIRRLLQLSGCNPFFLTKLCHIIYDRLCQKQGKFLTKEDVEQGLEETILNPVNKSDNSTLFDSLLGENDDEPKKKENVRRYLEAVAGKKSSVECRKHTIKYKINDNIIEKNEHWNDATVEEVETLLKSRGVIWEETDRNIIRIRVELLAEYLRV